MCHVDLTFSESFQSICQVLHVRACSEDISLSILPFQTQCIVYNCTSASFLKSSRHFISGALISFSADVKKIHHHQQIFATLFSSPAIRLRLSRPRECVCLLSKLFKFSMKPWQDRIEELKEFSADFRNRRNWL